MSVSEGVTPGQQNRAMWGSAAAFTVCFAVWTIFAIIGIRIKDELGLNNAQFGLMAGMPILVGSLIRVPLGIWTDQYGGRRVFTFVMLAAAVATFLLSWAHTYPQMLLAGAGVGIAGGSFAVGIAYVSRWYPAGKQGTALGVFGAGNVGAAVTKFCAPFVMVAWGWNTVAYIWAAGLVLMAIAFWFLTDEDPVIVERRAKGIKPQSAWLELEPLKNVQVWRFSLYYFFVFGAFVALSLWLPKYLMGVYGLTVQSAGMIAAAYSIPASLFRIYGGVLSDKYGARRVMYWTFIVSTVCCFILSYPPTEFVSQGANGPVTYSIAIGLIPFIVVAFVLGFFMSLGKAAVYKHIPVYYPKSVGAVGGLVGLMGGLGGFILPIVFGWLVDQTGIWSTCFMLLFAIVALSLIWMHFSIRQMEREAAGDVLAKLPELPEMQPIHGVEQQGALSAATLMDWRPEDPAFWESTGKPIARRNLTVSVCCLLLAFSVWMVWSMVVAKLPQAGFNFTTSQLFWLTALPGLCGATLRIFYSFVVPIFGGRLWTTLSTWSLIIPALGIGFVIQNPTTPYWVFVLLALLCGFGGGNFASSMSNISFFFPKREKGNALAINAGVGNLGVSVMQFLVPIVITMGIFGSLGGSPVTLTSPAGVQTTQWLQNAGYIWVPFIALSATAAWFWMNDIGSMKASFSDQAVIFRRKHNWLMCWLYTGTFGSFIGFSAAFPLLTKTQFPEVNALSYVFLGPLVGAVSRAFTGWISDRWGGGRVTIWVFILMMIGAGGVLYFVGIKHEPHAFYGFFACFLLLFFATGVGNASTFQMIPAIMAKDMNRLMPGADPVARQRQAEKESASIIGFSSAIAAYGAFFIPMSYGTSISMTGGPQAALWGSIIFYVSCLIVTWLFYTRKGGLLYDVERARTASANVHSAAE